MIKITLSERLNKIADDFEVDLSGHPVHQQNIDELRSIAEKVGRKQHVVKFDIDMSNKDKADEIGQLVVDILKKRGLT